MSHLEALRRSASERKITLRIDRANRSFCACTISPESFCLTACHAALSQELLPDGAPGAFVVAHKRGKRWVESVFLRGFYNGFRP